MDVRPGDILLMKKEHPCKNREFLVLRAGMDFRIRCTNVGARLWCRALKLKRTSSVSYGRSPMRRRRRGSLPA